jgi:nucleoside-triphosphatase THEP1
MKTEAAAASKSLVSIHQNEQHINYTIITIQTKDKENISTNKLNKNKHTKEQINLQVHHPRCVYVNQKKEVGSI